MIIYQIHFDTDSFNNCLKDHRVIPTPNYKNPHPYFENDVISELVPETETDRVGVFSHAYSKKIGIDLDKIEARNEDVVSFFALNYKNNYWELFERWHPTGLSVLEILKEKFDWTIDFTKQPKHVIYQNAFVAKTEIYEKYIQEYLNPVMSFLNENPELVNKEPNIPKYKGYTMHTFLCERLFTIFLEHNDYSVYQFNKLYD